MSRTTKITCDRCGRQIQGGRAWKVEMTSSRNTIRNTIELDWCEPCGIQVREPVKSALPALEAELNANGRFLP